MQGRTVAANPLGGNTRTPNHEGIPSVAFTAPPLARVGLDEDATTARGLRFAVHRDDTSGWFSFSYRRVALSRTAYKMVVEGGSVRILGAPLFGLHADEVVNLSGLEIRHGLTAGAMGDIVYAYPTSSWEISSMV